MKSNKIISNILYLILILSILSINNHSTIGKPSVQTVSDGNYMNSIQLQASNGTVELINSTFSSIVFASGNGTKGNPFVIDNISPIGDGTKDLLTIDGTETHYLIINSEFTGGYNGIVINNAKNVNITNNEIYLNNEHGVSFQNSWETTAKNNTVYENGMGTNCSPPSISLDQYKLNSHMGGGFHYDPSGNSTIEGNEIYRNYVAGIILEDAENVTIVGNNIYENGWNCDTFSNQGLSLSQPTHLTGYGILIQGATDSVIRYNQIEDNSNEGIMILSGGQSNLISTNNFVNNGDTIQAADYGTDNSFTCNFWNINSDDPYKFTGNTDQKTSKLLHNIDPPFLQTNPCDDKDSDEGGFSQWLIILIILIIIAIIIYFFWRWKNNSEEKK